MDNNFTRKTMSIKKVTLYYDAFLVRATNMDTHTHCVMDRGLSEIIGK